MPWETGHPPEKSPSIYQGGYPTHWRGDARSAASALPDPFNPESLCGKLQPHTPRMAHTARDSYKKGQELMEQGTPRLKTPRVRASTAGGRPSRWGGQEVINHRFQVTDYGRSTPRGGRPLPEQIGGATHRATKLVAARSAKKLRAPPTQYTNVTTMEDSSIVYCRPKASGDPRWKRIESDRGILQNIVRSFQLRGWTPPKRGTRGKSFYDTLYLDAVENFKTTYGCLP